MSDSFEDIVAALQEDQDLADADAWARAMEQVYAFVVPMTGMYLMDVIEAFNHAQSDGCKDCSAVVVEFCKQLFQTMYEGLVQANTPKDEL